MIRSDRHLRIIDLINKYEINTQEGLADKLRESGYSVTQATVSRDIKELGLIKIMTEDKKYKYSYVKPNHPQASDTIINLFKETVLSIQAAQNIIVIKCISGGASASAAMLDRLNIPEIIGTVAGDDTVLAVINSTVSVRKVISRLKQMIN